MQSNADVRPMREHALEMPFDAERVCACACTPASQRSHTFVIVSNYAFASKGARKRERK